MTAGADTRHVRAHGAPATRRTEEVRENILRHALSAFARNGYEGTTVRAVAKEAGVIHTLAAYHFGAKEELWLAVMDRLMASYEEAIDLDAIAASEGVAIEKVRIFVQRFIDYSARTPELHRMLAMEGDQESDRLRRLVAQHHRKVFETVCGWIADGQRDGSIRPGNPPILFYYIIGAGGTLFTVQTEYKILAGREAVSSEEQSEMAALIMNGIATG